MNENSNWYSVCVCTFQQKAIYRKFMNNIAEEHDNQELENSHELEAIIQAISASSAYRKRDTQSQDSHSVHSVSTAATGADWQSHGVPPSYLKVDEFRKGGILLTQDWF